jgi:hypothetical protein
MDSSGFDHLEIVITRMVTDDLSYESDYHPPEDDLYHESKKWMNFGLFIENAGSNYR